jgi:hypothetical protein
MEEAKGRIGRGSRGGEDEISQKPQLGRMIDPRSYVQDRLSMPAKTLGGEK